ncbi:3-isopropylmalate dehydrogenase [Hyphococcus formosus]|uniref:3-isopropylmalate dehydrogenase n=1 Tax=Hyphococcus formosus TaxID=3143534 RepID=UPI00398B503E
MKLLVLPGDGIGPEIVDQTLRVVNWFTENAGLTIEIDYGLAGGASIDDCGVPLSDEVFAKAKASDAVLFGAVGGPKWDALPRASRPEMGILRLRKGLDLYANLRPAISFSALLGASALRPEIVRDLDILIVRESTAGVYFGEPRGIVTSADGARAATDTQAYHENEIRRVCEVAFELARARNSRVCSVDKANVMETGALWRAVTTEFGNQNPDIELSHMYADNCAMQLVRAPKQFDVIVTDNLFGDILSDQAAALTGSLGLLPSATIAHGAAGQNFGVYEPIHGSAPDIAGKGIANPIATILSFAMCLRISLDASREAALLEEAVRLALSGGIRTPDIAAPGEKTVSSAGMTDAILSRLNDLSLKREA